MSAPEQSVQPEQAGQDAQHPAQQALAALAEGGVEFDVQALLRSAPASPLSKEAAVLILFGVLDNSPSTGKFDGCPENVSADLDVLLLVRAATLRSHAGQPAFPGGKIDPEDYALAETTGEPVAHIAALREAVEETGLDPAGVQILGQLHTLPLPISNFMVTPRACLVEQPRARRSRRPQRVRAHRPRARARPAQPRQPAHRLRQTRPHLTPHPRLRGAHARR